MKKVEQEKENLRVIDAWNSFVESAKKEPDIGHIPAMRLRTCNAYVCCIGKWITLTSYSTIVAILDSETRELYDVLRYRYGYTATSAKHIAKFANDYEAKERFTWRKL